MDAFMISKKSGGGDICITIPRPNSRGTHSLSLWRIWLWHSLNGLSVPAHQDTLEFHQKCQKTTTVGPLTSHKLQNKKYSRHHQVLQHQRAFGHTATVQYYKARKLNYKSTAACNTCSC